jgi:hypothetical protein
MEIGFARGLIGAAGPQNGMTMDEKVKRGFPFVSDI